MSKPKRRIMRFRKNDPTHNLLTAVCHYVRAKGGELVIVGGIDIEEWPSAGAGKFKVAVNCLGRKPTFAQRKEPSHE